MDAAEDDPHLPPRAALLLERTDAAILLAGAVAAVAILGYAAARYLKRAVELLQLSAGGTGIFVRIDIEDEVAA